MKRAIFFCLLLAGCATAPAPKVVTRIQIERVTIPGALLANPAPPPPPKVNTANAVAVWIARLWADDVNKTDQIGAITKLNP